MKRKKESEPKTELDKLQEELVSFESLSLEEKVKKSRELFQRYEFKEEKYPQLYNILDSAGKAMINISIKKTLKGIKKTLNEVKEKALDEFLVEDISAVDSHKVRDGLYDARIINIFGYMINNVYEDAMKQYAPALKEK